MPSAQGSPKSINLLSTSSRQAGIRSRVAKINFLWGDLSANASRECALVVQKIELNKASARARTLLEAKSV